MSLWGTIDDSLKSGIGGYLLGGPAGAALGAATALLSGPRKLNGSTASKLAGLPSLPGAGTAAAIGGTALGVLSITGKAPRKRRRSKGITASELKGFKRVACILSDYQKVKVQKNVKCAPKRRSSTCK